MSDYVQLSDFRATGAVTLDDLIYSQNVTSGIEQKTTVRQLQNFLLGSFAPTRQSVPVLAAGQTTYLTSGYTPGLVNVFVAGIRLNPSQYQAVDGLNIIILDAKVLAKLVVGMTVDIDAVLSTAVADVATVGSVNALMPANQPAAAALTGAELTSVTQSGGLFQSSLTKIAQWIVSTFQGFTQSGSNAVARTVQAKLSESVSAMDFGATGNGSTDDTAAIQAALNASTIVYFPPGVYVVSATLSAQPNTTLWAYDPDKTIIYRTGNYGDTLVCGSSTVSAGSFKAHNIWFKHSNFYTAGVNSLPNLVTSGAHIRLWGAQNCDIEGCYFLRLQYSIICHGGSIFNIHKNTFWLTWDPTYTAAQEGIAAVCMDSNNTFTYPNPKDLFLTHNEFLGCGSASRSVTLTDGNSNTKTVSMFQNIGPQFNLWVTGCETITATGNYFGDAATNNVFLNPIAPNGFVANARFADNLLDGSQQAQFNVQMGSTSANPILHLSIVNNDFNGELSTFRHLAVLSQGGLASVYDLDVSGNRMNASYGGGGIINGATDFTVKNNSITNYNCLGVTPSSSPVDAQWGSALYVAGPDAQNYFGLVEGNAIGGGGNTIGATGNYCWLGIYKDTTEVRVKIGRQMHLGVGATPLYGISEDIFDFVSGTTYQATAYTKTVFCGNTAPLTITLPTNAPSGTELCIKDINAAATNNITLSGNVDGNGNYVMNVNKQCVRLKCNGAGVWYII